MANDTIYSVTYRNFNNVFTLYDKDPDTIEIMARNVGSPVFSSRTISKQDFIARLRHLKADISDEDQSKIEQCAKALFAAGLKISAKNPRIICLPKGHQDYDQSPRKDSIASALRSALDIAKNNNLNEGIVKKLEEAKQYLDNSQFDRLEQAFKELEEMPELPPCGRLSYSYAHFLREVGESHQAEELFQKISASCLANGKLDKAITCAKYAIKCNSSNFENYSDLATFYQQSESHSEAVHTYLMGAVNIFHQLPEQALAFCEEAKGLEPQNLEVYTTYLNLLRLADNKESLQIVLSEYAEVCLNLAQSAEIESEKQQYYKKAAEAQKERLKQDLDENDRLQVLGSMFECYVKAKAWDSTKEAFKGITLIETEVLEAIAPAFISNGVPLPILKNIYRLSLSRLPREETIECQRLRKGVMANFCKRVIDTYKVDLSQEELAKYFNSAIRGFACNQKLEDAENMLIQAVDAFETLQDSESFLKRLEPHNWPHTDDSIPLPFVLKACCYGIELLDLEEDLKYDEAAELAFKALEIAQDINPHFKEQFELYQEHKKCDPRLYIGLYCEYNNQLEDAEEMLKRATESNPGDMDLFCAYTAFLVRRGKKEEAVKLHQRLQAKAFEVGDLSAMGRSIQVVQGIDPNLEYFSAAEKTDLITRRYISQLSTKVDEVSVELDQAKRTIANLIDHSKKFNNDIITGALKAAILCQKFAHVQYTDGLLRVKMSNITDEAMSVLRKYIMYDEPKTVITGLDFSGSTFNRDHGLNSVCDFSMLFYAKQVRHHIKMLMLSGTHIGDNGFFYVASAMAETNFKHIETLNFNECELSHESIPNIIKILECCPNLQELSLKNNKLGHNDLGQAKMYYSKVFFSELPSVIKQHKNLQKIDLRDNGFGKNMKYRIRNDADIEEAQKRGLELSL